MARHSQVLIHRGECFGWCWHPLGLTAFDGKFYYRVFTIGDDIANVQRYDFRYSRGPKKNNTCNMALLREAVRAAVAVFAS